MLSNGVVDPVFRARSDNPATASSVFADDPSFRDSLHKLLVESITDHAVFGISPNGSIISWNAGAQRIFGYAANEVLGKNYSLIFIPEDIRGGAPGAELAAARAQEQHVYERWHVRKNGTRFWGTNSVHPMFDDTGTLFGFAKLVHDITERYISQTALRDSEQRLRLLTESVDDCAIFSVGLDGTITSWNSGAQAIFGYANEEVLGAPLSLLYTPDDRHSGALALELDAAITHGYHTAERWLVRKDGTRFFSNGKLNVLNDELAGEPRSFVKVVHDVTERKRLALELHRHAFNDHLTQLPNRAAFFEHVRRAIALMKRRPAHLFAVLFVDLDRFKAVNDTYGHIVADRLLGVTARRLEQCVRSGDIVARLGGDEFAILLNGIDDPADASFAGERIGIEMSVPVTIEDHVVHVSASVGIALGSVAYETPEDILRDADFAMYAAKAEGRSGSVMYATEPPARPATYPQLG